MNNVYNASGATSIRGHLMNNTRSVLSALTKYCRVAIETDNKVLSLWDQSGNYYSMAPKSTLTVNKVPICSNATTGLLTDSAHMAENATGVGIGTASPEKLLHLQGTSNVNIYEDGYGSAPGIYGRRAAGTVALPTAVQAGQSLLAIGGMGYGTSSFSISKVQISMVAAENFTNAAQGTYIRFSTTPIGSTTAADAMRITDVGSVGIGTTSPDSNSKLHVNGNIAFDGELFNPTNDDDVSAISINYRGYNGGQTRNRDFVVYDGKGNSVLSIDGSLGSIGINRTIATLKTGSLIDAYRGGSETGNDGAGLYLHGSKNDATAGAYMRFYKDRGAAGSYITLTQDILGKISFYGYDGGDWVNGAEIRVIQDGSVSTEVPGTITFLTGTNTVAPAERLRIASAGDVYTVAMTDYSATSTIVGFSSINAKNITYKVVGKTIFVWFAIVGISNANNLTFTIPYNIDTQVGGILRMGVCVIQDNGVNEYGIIFTSTSNKNLITIYRNFGDSAYTTSGAKQCYGHFTAQIE